MARKTEHFDYHVGLGAGVYANSSLGTSGQVLKSDGTNVYWGNDSSSGGDAATLDGYDSTAFALLAAENVFTLKQTVNLNTSAAASPGTTGVTLHLSGSDGISTRLWLDSYGVGTNYTARRANGTNATKTALLAADLIMNNSAFGHDGTAYSTGSRGGFQIAASQNWAVGAHGTKIILLTTADGSTTLTSRWIVENDGSLIYSGGTATGVSTVNAVDYFDNGVNINTIYASLAATNTFTGNLIVNKSGVAVPTAFGSDEIRIVSATGNDALFWADSFGGPPVFGGRRAEGVPGTPTAVQSGNTLVALRGYGYGTSAYSASHRGSVSVLASENWTNTAQGTRIVLATTPNLGAAQSARWLVENDGSLIYSGGTATGVSTVNAVDYFDNGVNINTIYLASASYTAADVLSKLLTVDGSGSGLDADLWDGNNFATYLNQAVLTTSTPTFAGATLTAGLAVTSTAPSLVLVENDQGTDLKRWDFLATAGTLLFRMVNDANSLATNLATITRTSTYTTATWNFSSAVTLQYNSNTIWHAGNDGAGSGLDADTVDGYQASNLGRLAVASTWTDVQTFQNATTVYTKVETTATSGQTGLQIITRNGAAVAQNSYIYVASANDPAIQAASGSFGTIWFAGNDGAGSGLDADLLDGNSSAYFLAASTYTAADVLSKLLTVDGAGSGLDADLLDGNSSAYFLAASTYTAADVLSKLLTVDGAGSGLDADLWDGNNFATYLDQAVLTTSAPRFSSVYIGSDTDLRIYESSTNVMTLRAGGVGTETYLTIGASSFLQLSGATIWHSSNDGAASGLDADLLDGKNTGTSGNVVPLLDGNNTYSGTSAFTGAVTISRGAVPLQITTTVDNANVEGFILEGDRATPAANDIVYMNWRLSNSAGTQTEFGRQSIVASTVTAASEASYWMWAVRAAGTLTNVMRLSSSALTPQTTDGLALGSTSLMWSDLFLASGAVVNFNNGDVLLTHSANTLAFTGASSGYTFDAAVSATGLNLNSATSFLPQAIITNTNDDANAGYVIFYKTPADTTVTANDYLGTVLWYGHGSASASGTAATVYARAEGTRGTNWVAANLVLGSIQTSGSYRYLSLNADGTITWNSGAVWHAGNDGAGSGLDADLLDGKNTGTSGNVVGLLDGNNTYSGTSTFTGAATVNVNAATQFTVQRTDEGASGAQIDAIHVTTTQAVNDSPFTLRVIGRDSTNAATVYGRLRFFVTNATDTTEAGYWQIAPTTAGAETAGLTVTGTTMTFNSSTVWNAGNDGSGSGLDADLLDGNNIGTSGTAIPLLSGTNTWGAAQTFVSGTSFGSGAGAVQVTVNGAAATWRYISAKTNGVNRWDLVLANSAAESGSNAGSNFQLTSYDDAGASLRTDLTITRSTGAWAISSTSITAGGNTIWHAGNDGSGSGLDADLLDGKNTGTSGNAVPLLDGVNTWSGNQTMSTTGTGAPLTLTSTDAGASAFTFDLFRNSASPAASDGIAAIRFRGQNSTPATVTYSSIQSNISDPTAASEDAVLYLQTMMAGALTNVLTLGISTIEHRFTTPTDSIVSSQGTSGYGAFYSRGSGTNAAYMFFGNVTTGERGRIWATDSGVLSLSTNAGVTQHLAISSAGVLTASGNTIWHAGNDGSGSGLDADLLDGISSGGFMILANQAQRLSTTAGIDVSGGTAPSASTNSALEVFQATAGADAYITFHIGSDYAVHFGLDGGTNDLFVGGWSMGTSTANKIWHAGNDGAGSGLDADLWDGNNFATYLNQALLTSSNPTFANITSTGTNGLQVEGVAPIINMYETDAAVDKKRWRFVANNDVLSLTGVNDAYSAETGIFSISRTSYTAFTFVFSSATTITRNGSTLWDAGNDGAGSGLDADLLDGYTIGTSGSNIPILSGINTWSSLQTMSSLTARVTLTTAVSGTLTSAHANISVELNGNVTLNNSVFTAGDKTVFDPGTAARTFTRGAGVTMYVNGTDSATATLAANQIGGMHWRSASVVILTGAFS